MPRPVKPWIYCPSCDCNNCTTYKNEVSAYEQQLQEIQLAKLQKQKREEEIRAESMRMNAMVWMLINSDPISAPGIIAEALDLRDGQVAHRRKVYAEVLRDRVLNVELEPDESICRLIAAGAIRWPAIDGAYGVSKFPDSSGAELPPEDWPAWPTCPDCGKILVRRQHERACRGPL